MRKNKTKGKDVVVFALVVSNVYDRGCYHTPFQMRKTLWFDELSDPDLFFPSCPHLHSTDGQYKLNVYTGELYSTQSKKIVKGKVVKEKELERLWSDRKFMEFAEKMRTTYFEKYPLSSLPSVPSFSQTGIRKCISKFGKVQAIRGLLFRGRFKKRSSSL